MKAYLTRRYKFSASHRLHCESMSEEENRRVYGKCNNPFGHGHNYILEVTVSGTPAPDTGMICNLADLDAFVNGEVLEQYHDGNLNYMKQFQNVVPTTENLCMELHRVLQQKFYEAKVEKVRIQETMMNSFEYAGESAHA
jgi:6-pyruvoyltetrahydropterin/6-carboxytetrahydropterin synthase